MYFRIVKVEQGELAAHGFKACDKMIDTGSPQVQEFTGNFRITCSRRLRRRESRR